MDRDVELNFLTIKEDSLAQGSIYNMREPAYDRPGQSNALHRFVNSFRRDPSNRITPSFVAGAQDLSIREHNGSHYYDLHSANLATANSGLSRELKGRHLQMIAIGGSIGMLLPVIVVILLLAAGRSVAWAGFRLRRGVC